MTERELIIAVVDANEVVAPKLAVYKPSLTNAHRGKHGKTTLTFKVIQHEFTPDDALKGITAWLVMGTEPALRELLSSALKREAQS